MIRMPIIGYWMAASFTRLEVDAGEAGRQPSDLVEIDVRGKLHLGDVHVQDFATPGAVGAVDQHSRRRH